MKEVTANELAWLAGFWDADGSITVYSHQEKNGQKKICPSLLVTNTNELTIATIADMLDRLGTSFHVFERKSNTRKHKDSYQLSSRNVRYIKTVLEAMLPYLITKKAQAMLTLRYVSKKIEQSETNQRPRYDDEDFSLQKEIQALNKTGQSTEPSTTKGKALPLE